MLHKLLIQSHVVIVRGEAVSESDHMILQQIEGFNRFQSE
jgi:hypothetical protein